ncbi:E3 ubiquitin-protein ligase TM129-like [Convolutriloba macropyga]|uniref:E3 ubiquitin-protein ligase TM129-like n=1 Tax=Convolutriloba macropyga TaxID=536237 RepID=UPI003F5204ED
MMFPQEFILFSAFYLLGAFFIVVPPHEIRAAGFSIEYLFCNYLGNEMRDFVGYQIRRTSLNILIHSLLPIGYYFSGVLCTDYFYKYLTETAVFYWAAYVSCSLLIALYGVICFVKYSVRCHALHPLAISLRHQAAGSTSHSESSLSLNTAASASASSRNPGSSNNSSSQNRQGRGRNNSTGISWTLAANAVNAEMLQERDKFCSGPHNCRIFVTSNWLMQASIYTVNIVHKSDIHLVLTAKQELDFTTESRFAEEWVTVEVHSINGTVKPFHIRLRSQEYHELRERLSAPVVNARNIVLKQSISERFVAAFKAGLAENDKFLTYSSSGRRCATLVDQCIGCNVNLSDVKLVKGCSVPDCGNCFCRPMWCAVCLSKWFSARQDQNNPQVWLEGHAPCPTCRTKFCIADVSFIDDPVLNSDE